MEKMMQNQPSADFSKRETREGIQQALDDFPRNLEYKLRIGGKDVDTGNYLRSINPATKKVLGRVPYVSRSGIDDAINAAREASPGWKSRSIDDRVSIIRNLGSIIQGRSNFLGAMLINEAGKPWKEACAEVEEAVDFCNYYSAEMEKYKPRLTQQVLGQDNILSYEGLGEGSVIAPWNFPLAIYVGMLSAAIVTGNTVVGKPSPYTPLIAGEVMKMAKEAGIPDGVLNYIVCKDSDASRLVTHPDIHFIAFTGSEKVGKDINEKAAKVHKGQDHLKRVVVELGGKNGLIVAESADIDSAVLGVVQSAFGYSGQKCSACSRVMVVESKYEEFVDKLREATISLHVGDPSLPGTHVGPLINHKAYNKVLRILAHGEAQGAKYVLKGKADSSQGYFVHPSILTMDRENILAQEEVFGPVVGVIKVKDYEEAVEVFNSTRFGLTGGLYSRTPSQIENASSVLHAGNISINQKITGAMVGRQPFGGHKMSGIGFKAGGPNYLIQFMAETLCSNNQARRGHIPGIEEFAKG
jgi:RHH-type transcriptional regulator, proline utilization regulon repressor / proline dehydrogenase / delta 1-pyrroline-5-carboxylate dehydrogenase